MALRWIKSNSEQPLNPHNIAKFIASNFIVWIFCCFNVYPFLRVFMLVLRLFGARIYKPSNNADSIYKSQKSIKAVWL